MSATRVLFFASNPLRDAPVAVDVEARGILERIGADDRLDLVFVPAPRVTDVLRVAEQKRPAIVHLTGHGNTKELYFLGPDDMPTTIPVPTLAALMRQLGKDEARVVVLNYCESYEAARAIVADPEGGITCAVGTRSAIPDSEAITFAAAFYGAIASGLGVQRAFDDGKLQVQLVGGDPERLALCVRAGVEAAEVLWSGPEVVGMAMMPGPDDTLAMVAMAPPPAPTRNLLRSPPADFTGRARELAEVTAKRGAAGVLVSGQGGVGKTALALEIAAGLAESYPDAQIDISLRGSTGSPLPVEEAMAEVIHAFDAGARLPPRREALAGLYRATLHGKRVLLLLDDAKDLDQIAPLLPPAGSFVLATAWTWFVAPGIEPYDLCEMSREDAVALVRRIAGRLSEPEAGELAERCGYLPLALRAAAGTLAQRRDLRPARYLERLRSADERVKLIEAVLREGADLLPPHARAAWEVLGVFVADFDLDAAAAVFGVDQDAAADALGQILQQNLIEYDELADRYRLHDLVRDYLRLQMSPDAAQAAGMRFTEHFARLAIAASARVADGGGEMLEGLTTFDRERRNIAVALSWSMERAEADARIAALMTRLLSGSAYSLALREQAADRAAWFGAAVAAAKRGGDRATAVILLGNQGAALLEQNHVPGALAAHQEELAIARELGDPRAIAVACGNLGVARWVAKLLDEAVPLFEEQLALARSTGDRRIEANALGNLGNAAWSRGDPVKANGLYAERLAITRAIGDKRGEGTALGNLAGTLAEMGEVDEALSLLEQRLALAIEIGDRRGEGAALGNMGSCYRRRGDPPKAIDFLQRQLAIAEQLGDERAEDHALGQIAGAYWDAGDQEKSATYAVRKQALWRPGALSPDPAWNLGDGDLPPILQQQQMSYGGTQGAFEVGDGGPMAPW